MGRWWGLDKGSALELDCTTPPTPGAPIVHLGDGKASPRPLAATGIADDAIQGRHLSALSQMIFGFQNDGNFIADGVRDGTSVGLGAPAGSVYTLTRDVNFDHLVVQTGVTLKSAFRITARRLELQGSCVIHNDGGAGGAGTSGGGQGAGGTTASGGSISSTAQGSGVGGGGGSAGGAGVPGTAAQTVTGPFAGGAGGAGATGTTSTGAGAAGGGKTTPGSATTSSIFVYPKMVEFFDTIQGKGIGGGGAGSGGGGGGGGGAGSTGGGGGGGGGAPGVVIVVADVLDMTTWTGRISANGGQGGSGAVGTLSTAPQGGTGGMGCAGGGGIVEAIFRKVVGGTPYIVDVNSLPSLAGGLPTTYVDPPGSITARQGLIAAAGSALNLDFPTAGRVVYVNMTSPFLPSGRVPPPRALPVRAWQIMRRVAYQAFNRFS